MGDNKLCLLLLLVSGYALAQQRGDNDEQTSTCPLASRFKAYKKYVYQYTTLSTNGVVGAANLRNGPKVTCQVEIEVPQICSFVLYTRDCAVFEVTAMDPNGQPVFSQAASSEDFQAAMEKNILKFTVEQLTSIQLFPEEDEPVNILNIKRGIISALIMPDSEDEQINLMSTVHGECLTDYQVNARRDIATDVTLTRDLSRCDQFHSRELASSPLALLQKLHHPLSKLIRSTQDCNYQYDNKRKHMTAAKCTEKHIFLPFSHEDNGMSSEVIQIFTFQEVVRINNRVFEAKASHSKPLHFEDPDDKAPIQTKEATLRILRDLVDLAGTDQGHKRTGLFYELVSSLRGLRNETLSQTVTEMLDVSGLLTWQALLQCGTPECTSAILQNIRTVDRLTLEVDALVYGLSLQADPDAHRVRDMLSLAQYRQGKAVMYALANTVKKFHKGDVTPVVTDVADFMETLLDDCSGDVDVSFLTLRVVGVMGPAMQAASRSLISSLLLCATKKNIPLPNQKAAIQAFRLMDVTDEIRNMLMEVYQDAQSSVEKRIAAYLILMKNPNPGLLAEIVNSLNNEREEQLRSFVVSHMKNILKSNEPQLEPLRESLKDYLYPTNEDLIGMSKNYKVDTPVVSAQGNIIFDPAETLPKEVMLETTLKAFDYNYNIFEVGIEGAGFEPTIEALFGEKGFFPDVISRVLYWAGDEAPQRLQQVLDRIAPDRSRMKRQLPQSFLHDIADSVKKLVDDLRSSPAPEVTAYLRLLGDEMGYIRTSEMRQMAETLYMYYHVFLRIYPAKAIHALTSSTDNELFAHYIFTENAFSLPTAAGFPLKFSLAGVFSPGAKGGLAFSPGMKQLSFMPSVGLEFITHMGVHIPDFVATGTEMRTKMYHESSLQTKVTIDRNQIRLSIPAPSSNTQVFSLSNDLLSVSSGQTTRIPPLLQDQTDSTDCQPLFTGMNLCTIAQYSTPTSMDHAPYYPLTGPTRFAIEIQPTGEVSEYTATVTAETLREGKDGRHKVDALKLILKAEGVDSAEATASLKYNRMKNTVTTDVTIPSCDVEAGIKLAVTDTNTKGKKMRGITIDVTNRNIPQLTLVGSMKHEMMKDAMLQVQMAIPSLKMNGSVTGTLKSDDGIIMTVETAFNIPETSYQQKATLKYDDKLELELNSDLNSEFMKLIPNTENYYRQLQQLVDDLLDQRVAKTDMKLRHIVTKGIEAGNIWLDKLAAGIPYFENLRNKRSISDLALPALPEKLFLQSDALFRYQFNEDKMVVSLPLPLGGKTSQELNIPTSLSTPPIHLPKIGLDFPSKNYPLPSFTIPQSLDFMVPLLGLFEASTKINSNFYSWEGSISGGNNTIDVPSYIAQYKAMAQSPFNILSYKLEGTGMISGKPDENIKYLVDGSFSHCLIETSFSAIETFTVTNNLQATVNYQVEASSPVGLHTSLYYSAQSTSTLDSDEVRGDGNFDGTIKIGSLYTNTSYRHNYNLRPLDREGRGNSDLHITSPFLKLHNTIYGVYADSELNVISKTNVQNDGLKHTAELKYKDAQLTLKCHAVATAMDKSLNNKVEFGVSSQMAILRIESQVDDATNRAYSLITGFLNSNGLDINSEGSLTFDAGRGLHKASVMIRRDGLTTSGINSIQCSPVIFENIFNGAIDHNGASLSSNSKVMAEESRGELTIEGKITGTEAALYGDLKGHIHDATTKNSLNVVLNRRALTFSSNSIGTLRQIKTENSHTLTLTLWTLDLRSKTNNFICDDIYYKQDTKVNMKPFVVSFDVTNDLKFYEASLDNEAHMKLQPLKMDLSGGTKGAYGDDHIKHNYEFNYDDMAGKLKCTTSGNVMDAQLSHNCEFEFAGLSSKSSCEAQINSEPLRFESTVRTMAKPFTLTIDALVNSDGKINLFGKNTGQLYSKLLVKAEPLALAYLHESRVSTMHSLPCGEFSTQVDNTFDGLLTPIKQSLSWKTKSKLNDHVYNQDMSTYNDPDNIGFEFAGILFTDVFSKLSKGINRRSAPENQEFSMSGFLKYDKSSDCHIIEIPFIERIPVAFEQLKRTLVKTLESLQQVITELDISQVIADFRANLDQLPLQVRDYMRNMDLETKVNQIKEKLAYLTNEFSVTMDDLEIAMDNLKKNFENTVIDIATKTKNLILTIRDYFKEGSFADMITNLLAQIGNDLQDFNDKYEIKRSFVKLINAIEDVIGQIDLQKLTEGSAAWLRQLDSKYGLLKRIKEKVSELKQAIEAFDVKTFCRDVKDYILSIDVANYVEQLPYKIPDLEIAKVIESMNDVIVNWIEEYEIPNKFNTVYFYIRDLVVKYELDDKLKELMDQAVMLIKDFKIEETVQLIVDALKNINLEHIYDTVMQFLQSVTSQLRAIDFEQSINELNKSISAILRSIREFDYNDFVDETNKKIAEITNYINEQLKTYEIVEKLEAVRDFFRDIQTSIIVSLEELKNTKVADAIKKLHNVLETTVYNDIKLKAQEILDDMRQRILDMDIRDEIYIYLQRASESYTNMVAYLSVQISQLIEGISKLVKDHEIIDEIKQAVDEILDAMKTAEIEVPAFALPLTDLVIPAFTLNLNKLQEISIPSQFSIPKFTVFNSYTIPAFTINFEEIKEKLIAAIDYLKAFQIQMPNPEDIFGNLKVLYLSELPDLTFPEITLSEIKFPAINIPKLNCEDFRITMLHIPEFKMPEISNDICIPRFGKLHGEFRLSSPHYSVLTAGKIENSTTTSKSPQFTATMTSQAKSTFECLEYTWDATAQLEAPRMKKLLFTETLKVTHKAFSIDHSGSLTLTGSSAEASTNTITKATTNMYTADLVNVMQLTLKSGISANMETTYNHKLDIPTARISSQATMTKITAAKIEAGTITFTSDCTGNGKWSIKDYSDEGTHKSNLALNINYSTAKLTFEAETNFSLMKMKQALTIESVILSHITVNARAEALSLKSSVMVLDAKADFGDLKITLTASYNVKSEKPFTGSISNSLEFMAHPFEIVLDAKNKVNTNIFSLYPLKLLGKMDLQHDFGVILNSEIQRAHLFTLARFNQYKYNHNLTFDCNERDMVFHLTANGKANLEFLTVPLTVPELTLPYLEIKTPEIKELSLWEDVGFKTLLTTPHQSFDMNLKLHYHKNPEMHSFQLNLAPIYATIHHNANIIQAQFEHCRDKLVALLKDSYNQAKLQYEKHKIDTSSQPPRFFTVPGYKIPILNIEVSAFRAELPAFSFFVPKEVNTPGFKIPALGFTVPSYTLVLPSLALPVIHVPETLSEVNLPTFTLPAIQDNFVIPALGNLTYDFTFKSDVITVNVNAGLHNQSDIIALLHASSTSVFDILNGKIDVGSSLSRKQGMELANTIYLLHQNVEVNHNCAVSLTKKNMKATVANIAQINLPFLNVELSQDLSGDTWTTPNVISKLKLTYMFNIPLIESVGKGNIDLNLLLNLFSSYMALETSTKGRSDITIMDSCNFAVNLENVANFHLNANSLRSTVNTLFNTDIDKQAKQKRSLNNVFHYEMQKNFALEVSLRRVFAAADYTSFNNLDFAPFNSNGKLIVKGLLDFVPLTTLKATMNIDASQPSSLGPAELLQSIDLAVTSEKQSFTWSGKERLAYIIHACDLLLSNDEVEVRLDLTESLEGHLAFLKSVKIPVYHKSLWDVLKFDQVTNMDSLQFLNISSSVVYTKSMDGLEFAIPAKLFENGVTFSIPEIILAVPAWVKEIPHSIWNPDMQFENSNVPDHLILPPVISVPAFDVPFTTLHVEPFTVDLKNVKIPEVITTSAFEIMLPGLPKMSVPSYNIDTEYLQGKMSFLSFKMPQYEITIPSFSLPKSFNIGQLTISLDDITNHIANFEVPAIVISEQKLEIPEITLHFPLSVFIPAFGALTTTLKVSSPIYNVATTASLEKKDSSLVTSLNSICTSTSFLAYDLDARATLGFDNEVISLNGKCNLIHNDINVDWQHIFAQSMRMKRQASQLDAMVYRHTLSIDVISPTFVDASFRFASRKDSITASVSSPSSGFLGLHFQRRSASQLHGKLFCRFLSAPEKDTDILTIKATLRNSEKLNLQTAWNLDALHHVIEGSKDKIPAITEAVLKFINKYHTAHFGFDLNRGGMKLKNSVSRVIEQAFNELSMPFDKLQNAIEQLSDQSKDMYRKASDSLLSINVQEVTNSLNYNARQFLRRSEERIRVVIDAIARFLSEIQFTLPGSQERLTGLEIFRRARRSASRAFDRAVQRFVSLMDTTANHFRELEFTIPGTDVVVNGEKIMENWKSSLRYIHDQLVEATHSWFEMLRTTISDIFRVISQKGKELIAYLNDENHEIVAQIDALHAEALQYSKRCIGEVRRNMAEYKDLTKEKVQEAYDAMNMEDINDDLKEFIRILQSHFYGGINECIDLMRRVSENIPYMREHNVHKPYIRVINKKMDIDIPLPFFWKSFSEWPTQSRQ